MRATVAVCTAALLALQLCSADTITANMGYTIDTPLFKKYAVMNSGLLDADRYNDTIIGALGTMKARALVTDIYMGTSNANASFRNVIAGNGGTAATNGETYDFGQLNEFITNLGSQLVYPYLAITYNPTAFQPPVTAANSSGYATCLGFEAYAPDYYACTPQGYNGFDNCWKCPPKNADGSGYSQWEEVMGVFGATTAELNVSSYLQVWNEPDLTTYFSSSDPNSATFFAGNAEDYNQMYLASNNGLRAGDEHAIVGGPGVSFWVSANPGVDPVNDIASATNVVLTAVNNSLPLDFISFHVVTSCSDPSTCTSANNGGQATFILRAQFARYALTQPVAVLDGGRFNTTEIHCTEYFSGTQGYQYGLPFTASPALGILMLNDFVAYLNQTDVSQITWAQYMEPSQQNGTGLLDLDGNARPAWHAFRFYGDLPVERVSTNTTNAQLQSIAGFNRFECHGSVLIWNNASAAVPLSVSILQLPYKNFTVQVYQLNNDSLPGPGLSLPPTNTLTDQTLAADGSYTLDLPNFTLPEDGIVYVNITGNDCTLAPNYPSGRVLKVHSYYDKRPAMTLKYGEFDQRTWTAYVGMGNETVGSAIAGATVLVDPAIQLNITMDFINVPAAPASPGILLRVDYWDEATKSYPAANSFAFYQTGASSNYTFPPLFGSTEAIPAANYVPVNFANFGFEPNNAAYPTPSNWDGQMSLNLMLQDGPANSIVRMYVQQNANQPASVAASTTVASATNSAAASSTAG